MINIVNYNLWGILSEIQDEDDKYDKYKKYRSQEDWTGNYTAFLNRNKNWICDETEKVQ